MSSSTLAGARAQALALRRDGRRAHLQRTLRRATAVLAAVASSFVGITTAAAYFNGGGSGNGSATTGALNVTVEAVTGTSTTPLTPGHPGDVVLAIKNSNAFQVTLDKVVANGAITPDAAHADLLCTAAGGIVTFTPPASPQGSVLPGNGVTTEVHLSGAAFMTTAAANGCQNAKFAIPVSITVHKP